LIVYCRRAEVYVKIMRKVSGEGVAFAKAEMDRMKKVLVTNLTNFFLLQLTKETK